MDTSKQALENWLNETGLNKAGLLQTLEDNGVTSLNDFNDLANEDDVKEFVEALELKIILRRQLKRQLLALINNNNSVCINAHKIYHTIYRTLLICILFLFFTLHHHIFGFIIYPIICDLLCNLV